MPDIGFHFLTNAIDVTPATIGEDKFGWETKKASEIGGAGHIWAIRDTCPQKGKAKSIDVWLKNDTGAASKVKCALYKVSDASFVGKTEEKSIVNGFDGKETFNFTVKPDAENIAYKICVFTEGAVKIFYGGELGYTLEHNAEAYNDFPATWSGFSLSNQALSIYCTIDELWQDVDVSAHIPVGSTGVVLDIHNIHASTNYKVDVRKKGSTDDDYANGTIYHLAHIYAAIGVDANRKFQAKIESTDIKIWLVGYADSKVTFFTNYKDYTPAAGLSAWRDADVSADVSADATGVILKLVNPFLVSYPHDVRKKGSTEDYFADGKVYGYGHIFVLVGINNAKVFQYYLPTTGQKQYLVGYCEPPVNFYTNGVDVTPAVAGSWQDVDLSDKLKADAEGAILRIRNTNGTPPLYQGEVRKKTSTDDRHTTADVIPDGQIGALVGVDANKMCQAYIENTAVKIYLYGPMPPVVPPAKPLINKPLINPILVNPPMIRLKKRGIVNRICLQGCIWLLR